MANRYLYERVAKQISREFGRTCSHFDVERAHQNYEAGRNLNDLMQREMVKALREYGVEIEVRDA